MDDSEQENSNHRAVVETMWRALSDMDWEAMKRCMHPEIHYIDVPSDDPGAHGPENCIRRLRIAFNHLSKQEQETHHLAVDGDLVFIDHTETWTFTSGETAAHRFVSMHEMKEGLIYRWSDFWDMQRFVGQFPGWFLEEMAKASAEDFTD